MPLSFIVITRLAIIMLLCINAAGAPPFCSLPGGSSCPTGSRGTFIMWRRGGLTLWRLEEFGPAHHSASETEEGGDGESGKDRKKRAACAIIDVPLQRKMQSQLHKHHASTE